PPAARSFAIVARNDQSCMPLAAASWLHAEERLDFVARGHGGPTARRVHVRSVRGNYGGRDERKKCPRRGQVLILLEFVLPMKPAVSLASPILAHVRPAMPCKRLCLPLNLYRATPRLAGRPPRATAKHNAAAIGGRI